MRAIANPLQGLTADSQYVRDYLQALRGPVVLAGHSYGGSVITNAAAGLANIKALNFVNYFAGDLPRSQARLLWASQRGSSTGAFTTPSTAAAWKTIPSWYFISTGDQIVTDASKLRMAHRAHSHITMFRGGSHLTLISHPNAVTAVITSAICSRH